MADVVRFSKVMQSQKSFNHPKFVEVTVYAHSFMQNTRQKKPSLCPTALLIPLVSASLVSIYKYVFSSSFAESDVLYVQMVLMQSIVQ